jgi:uncharacterized protein (TIGR02246 family)
MRVFAAVCTLLFCGLAAGQDRQSDAQQKCTTQQQATAEAKANRPVANKPEAQTAEEAIRRSAEDFVAAFNRGDAQAVAAQWTTDGDYADESGRLVRGRDAIAAEYAAFFAANPGEKIKVVVDSVRLLDPNVALEDGSSALDPAPPGTAPSRYTAVHVRRGGKWLLASVRETRVEPTPHHARLQALDWLIGTWESEGSGAKIEITCRWAVEKSFIEVTHVLRDGDRVVESAREIVGWDPLSERITSWMFNSDGGHAVGTWLPRKHGWTIEFSGVTADGARTSAVNIMVRLKGAIVWKSVLRSAEGSALADTEEVVLRRTGEGAGG